jgi:hypothetical protein
MATMVCYIYLISVIQKVLQVTGGSKFLEIIEMIKKVLKNMKQTSYGKKIYDNLMANYGQYLSTTNVGKNTNAINKSNNNNSYVKKIKNNTSS